MNWILEYWPVAAKDMLGIFAIAALHEGIRLLHRGARDTRHVR